MMRITQGTFSFLPDLTDDQITRQVAYCQRNGWAVNIEFTDDPHPRNTYWEMWGQPMFDLKDPAGVLYELAECRKVHQGRSYIRVSAFDSTAGWESVRLSFLTDRPEDEPGFALQRQEAEGRSIRYTTRAYSADKPVGSRY
jgi:ribulose-bisphosphate carboxylase small chain